VGSILAKIGDEIGDPPPSVFELIVTDHIKFVDPKLYGLSTEGIDPSDYFITSGDAVEKAKILDRDIWHLAGELRKELKLLIPDDARTILFKDYEAAMWKAAGQSRKMLNALKKAKGVNFFLETEWDDHKLLCIPKNPRTPRL